MTDFRALCEELLDELELWSSWHDATDLKDRAGSALHFALAEQPVGEGPLKERPDFIAGYREGLADRRRIIEHEEAERPTALAEQPVGPTDEELRDLWSWSAGQDLGPWPTQYHCFARAVLARWGQS
jgi:hypothetical protein